MHRGFFVATNFPKGHNPRWTANDPHASSSIPQWTENPSKLHISSKLEINSLIDFELRLFINLES
jgi:hypothetical protein